MRNFERVSFHFGSFIHCLNSFMNQNNCDWSQLNIPVEIVSFYKENSFFRSNEIENELSISSRRDRICWCFLKLYQKKCEINSLETHLKIEGSIKMKLKSVKESLILGETIEWTSFHLHLQNTINCKQNDTQMIGVQSKILGVVSNCLHWSVWKE